MQTQHEDERCRAVLLLRSVSLLIEAPEEQRMSEPKIFSFSFKSALGLD